MKSDRRRSDPTLMLSILAGALCLAAWRALSNVEPDQAFSIIKSLAPVAIGSIGLASALATQRFLSTRRALGSRRAVAVVPADEFEVSIETVLGLLLNSRDQIVPCVAGCAAERRRSGSPSTLTRREGSST